VADNVTIPAVGSVIATDQVGSTHYQRVKLVDGTAEGEGAIAGDATNGLDVDVTRLPALVTGSAVIGGVKLVDDGGTLYGVQHITNRPRVVATPYLYAIAEGDVSGHYPLHKVGYNADIDDASETLWPYGGEYVFPPSAMQMEVISSSVDDDGSPAGTGVQQVEIHYLDGSWEEQEETVTLNGTTAVATVATDIYRVQSMHAVAVGSGGVAAGNIDLREVDDSPVYARIPLGYNNALSAVWTVPAGKTLFITGWGQGVGNAAGNRMATFRLRATMNEGVYLAGVFQVTSLVVLQDMANKVEFDIPIACPAKTDIKISAVSDSITANAICSASFEGWYE
jgi:hypothetical protein